MLMSFTTMSVSTHGSTLCLRDLHQSGVDYDLILDVVYSGVNQLFVKPTMLYERRSIAFSHFNSLLMSFQVGPSRYAKEYTCQVSVFFCRIVVKFLCHLFSFSKPFGGRHLSLFCWTKSLLSRFQHRFFHYFQTNAVKFLLWELSGNHVVHYYQ